eukprot:6331567-Lingulodinium_polyedra.AAC.1
MRIRFWATLRCLVLDRARIELGRDNLFDCPTKLNTLVHSSTGDVKPLVVGALPVWLLLSFSGLLAAPLGARS